jgi:hypothetical protein
MDQEFVEKKFLTLEGNLRGEIRRAVPAETLGVHW